MQTSESKTTFIYLNEELIDQELNCPICLEPLQEPVTHSSCGQMFCKLCIQQTKSSRCPVCRISVSTSLHSVPKMVTNKLNSLKVLCSKCESGVERGEFEKHFLACPIPCPNKCGEKLNPSQLENHLKNECKNIPVNCPAKEVMCPFSGNRDELAKHLETCEYKKFQPIFTLLLHRIASLEKQVKELQDSPSQPPPPPPPPIPMLAPPPPPPPPPPETGRNYFEDRSRAALLRDIQRGTRLHPVIPPPPIRNSRSQRRN